MQTQTPRILSLHIGMPRELGTPGAADPMERPWTSGIHKQPVTGPVWLTRTGLTGDGQADLRVHGGPEKAVLAYAASHHAFWREQLGREDLGPGAFGENWVVSGGAEESVCIGDVLKVGTAVVQVSQPRQPCWKPARRWRHKELALLIQRTGRTGWYFRVLQEGEVRAGDVLELVERPHPRFTVTFANQAMHEQRPEDAAALADCLLLTPRWRESLHRRAQGNRGDDAPRLTGPNSDG
ncbi:MOSC domain-containing protein [Myxococcus sp. MISCRS1]|jgi:MOSC domain-containing protein YiiM|uniref:MOSC domain-containing protein n=1 Tax=Myxococcus TaxID=32 RepID=UPI001CBF8B0D|nr:MULTISPECIES: MOSC domain-containing protein [unclassified Myxococcus]MBZ4395494.1 MOSC domain-containing protein [Myxococcus sp. AS-1-15]MBZ4411957.1 MOSC domain-containing protein [Myxococcus sp. XM-1-1-1]MCY0999152.1 MOSC domain-containing protein [Myxococcus sp. MISCRS1]BDT30842.1 MOSC domain-containing protein [Myxococcus sp. MH1]